MNGQGAAQTSHVLPTEHDTMKIAGHYQTQDPTQYRAASNLMALLQDPA